MKLSVVVCTYQRYDALADCLLALRSKIQTAPADLYEVVVVDNTPASARRSSKQFKADKWTVCDELGLSNARNAGIAVADGEIIAFIDDDAIAVPEWCQEVIGAFDRNPDAVAVGGKVVPQYPNDRCPSWMTPKLSEYLSCIDWGDREHVLRSGEWIVGANMAYRRSVFEGDNLFDPGLGRKGNLGLMSNEEIAVIRRIGRERIVYSPKMLVRHVIADSRLNQTWFRKRVFWQAISDQLAGVDVPPIDSVWKEFRSLVPRLPAERRNLLGLAAECGNAEEFSVQLRQLHLIALLLADGMAQA